MEICVFLSDEQEKVALDFDPQDLAEMLTREALCEEGIEENAEVSLTLTDNENICVLNKEFRNIDRETDVLSFPLADEGGFEVNPETGALLLGDIVISLERAKAQSEEYGHSLKREVAFLIAHSLFHLLGYDHMTPDEEKEMFAKQEKVLQKVGITR